MGTRRIKWGILGTSFISEVMAKAIQDSETAELVAIASRAEERACEFALKYKIPQFYDSYAKLLGDPAIEAVYIGLPNHVHKEWILKSAQASKHILCEKPLVLSSLETYEVMDEVRRAGVICMEALMYRHHPFIQEIKQIVDSEELGGIRHINAFYSANIAHVANTVAGGAIRNLGCYPISLIQYLLGLPAQGCFGSVQNNNFAAPRKACIRLQYPGHISALVATADDIEMAWQFDVFAEKAHLHLQSNPWLPGQDNNYAILKTGTTLRHIRTEAIKSLYCYQIDNMSSAIILNNPLSPELISLEDSLATMRILENWQCEN